MLLNWQRDPGPLSEAESVSRKVRIHGSGFGTVGLPAAGEASLALYHLFTPSPSPMASACRSHAFIRHFRGRREGRAPDLEQLRSRNQKLIHKGSSARPDTEGTPGSAVQ